ncbi:hypothetical protein BD289DRAFT_436275 [Coniella lustricola]|uniref:Secreted protein n=1 Tax=Coniella lustricola TaxID=2025994 RepID=A0A2T3A5F9_9PEZI|nr:hypothetical protein BD289DRAFT_436275 [Coniella lustricola]
MLVTRLRLSVLVLFWTGKPPVWPSCLEIHCCISIIDCAPDLLSLLHIPYSISISRCSHPVQSPPSSSRTSKSTLVDAIVEAE